jgi:hypothetical protein
MASYLDTGSGDATECLGNWMSANVIAGIKGFRCQFGYYGYRALYPFEDIVRGVSLAGYPTHLVLGSNNGSLMQTHLEWTYEIIQKGSNSSLNVIAFSNALFHPKTIHIEREDGSVAALVGSANLTENGLGLNVEAAISLDSRDGDDSILLKKIASAIERWNSVSQPGVFHIEDEADISSLKQADLIDKAQPSSKQSGGGGSVGNGGAVSGQAAGVRSRLWTAQRRPPAAAGVGTGGTPSSVTPSSTPATPPTTNAPARSLTIARWCKELKSSDAQWVSANTNPTGKLRLSQAKHPIDQRRYFRYQLFGNEAWFQTIRGANSYDVADVEFDVTIRGKSLGKINLRIDHAPHREAAQNNVTTVLAWGPINKILTASSHVGDWVAIERDTSGNFSLAIQQSRPTWAP